MRPTLALLAVVLGSCNGSNGTQTVPKPSPRALDFSGRATPISAADAARVSSIKLTSRIPARVAADCRVATFRCPRRIPAGGLTRIPYVSGPLEAGRSLYVLSFNNGTIPGHTHWIVGAGTSAAVSRNLIDDRDHERKGLPERIALRQLGTTRIAVYRWYRNAGGYLTGHTAAFADRGNRVLFASVHGHGHEDADIALVADMLAEAP